MADTKITALAAITTVDPAADVLPIVDISDTSMAASGTTKKITSNQILGAGGTATLASATITGDLTVDTSTLKVDSTNNRVGIGTATPSGLLTLNQASGAYSLNMDGGGYGTMASFGIVNVGVDNNSYIGSVGNNNFLIRVANSTRATFDQSGHFNLANGNVVMTTSGKGIDFSATASGSGTMTSELLNDYEEGTWTGTLNGLTTNPTVPVIATGKYTKVGRQVTVVIFFNNVSTVGASGQVYIQGLPFTEDGGRAAGTAAFYNFDFNGGTGLFVDVSGTSLYCQSQLTNAAWRDVNHSAGVGRYLRVTATYNV